MSHPHQVYGGGGGAGGYQQPQQVTAAVAAGQQQQQQFLGVAAAQMSNFTPQQQYEVWQQYYSQIGIQQAQQQQQHPHQTLPFLTHSIQSMAQPSVLSPPSSSTASSLAMLHQQQQQSQLLVQHQHQQQLSPSAPQHYVVGGATAEMGGIGIGTSNNNNNNINTSSSASSLAMANAIVAGGGVAATAAPMMVSPSSSAGLAASLVVQQHQQYLQQAALLAHQHHQHQQQQQYHIQQQQRQVAVVQPQQQQQMQHQQQHVPGGSMGVAAAAAATTPNNNGIAVAGIGGGGGGSNPFVAAPQTATVQQNVVAHQSAAAAVGVPQLQQHQMYQHQSNQQQQQKQQHQLLISSHQASYVQQQMQQQQSPLKQQQQHEKWDPIKEFGLQKEEMTLKSPPNANTVAENARLLKQRETEADAERQAYEANESQRVQAALEQQRASAKDAANALQQRVDSFPEPIHLAGCHTLSKVSTFLPFPTELSSGSTMLPCFDLCQADQVLANTDEGLADYLATLLSDTTDELRKIELKYSEEGNSSGDLDGIAAVPPMVQTIQAMNSFAFSVDPLDDDQEAMAQAFQTDIQDAVERMNSDAGMAAMAVAMFEAQQRGNHDDLFLGTSSISGGQQIQQQQQAVPGSTANNLVKSGEGQGTEIRHHQRQQIVSIGKPGYGARRKKDMVESLYDSLTGYFDPGSKDKRRRGRTRYTSDGEELLEEEGGDGSPTASNDRYSEEPSDSATDQLTGSNRGEQQQKSRKRLRVDHEEDGISGGTTKMTKLSSTNRPPTPTEVIQQRELEWSERQRQREEKYKRRRQQRHGIATDGAMPSSASMMTNTIEGDDAWTVDVRAEQESFVKFIGLVEQVLEQMDEALGNTLLTGNLQQRDETSVAGLLLDRALLDDLRVEAQKLKAWQKLSDVATERLVKLLTVLEKNIRDVLTENGALLSMLTGGGIKANEEDESDDALKELMDERVLRSVDASLVALCIMTSKKMPKQVLIEDIIERSVQLCKQCLHHLVYPAIDATLKSAHYFTGSTSNRAGSLSLSARKSFTAAAAAAAYDHHQQVSGTARRFVAAGSGGGGTKNNSLVNQLYVRMVDLFTCFSELVSIHNLNETLLVELCSLGCPPFFEEGVPELQMQSIKLLPTIFAKCSAQRKPLLHDLIHSLHRLPVGRQQHNMRNTYRLSATEHISNFTVLILQLIQSVVQLPSTRKPHYSHHSGTDGGGDHRSRRSSAEGGKDPDDQLVLDSYKEAKEMAAYFLGGFLSKCTVRSEDDNRRIFDQFLQDILIALYRPLWPVAELIVTVLGTLLVWHFRSKNNISRVALDYLGVIAARLRKDRVHALSVDASAQEKQRLNAIVRSILYDEQHLHDPTTASNNSGSTGSNMTDKGVNDIDICHLSSSEKVRKLEQALFDFIIWTTWEGDVSMEYVLRFYAVEWYRETLIDVEIVKERYKSAMAQGNAISQKERQKYEQKLTRILEKGTSMKTFITALMDKQQLKRRVQMLAKTGNVMVDSDALWVVKYLASKKELSQSFDMYLKNILEGFNPDLYPVAIRAKAMKCLAQIVEADYQVLMIAEVNKIVQDRLIDANASVREATFDLIGKFLVTRPDLLDTYYSILINRTKDTAVAVRKRVIRILRDIVFSRPDYERRPQILVELLQRVNDEDGVRKLCLETFQQLWFQPIADKQKLREKIILMVETAKCCMADGFTEFFETTICAIAKQQRVGTGQESAAIFHACKQTVDTLVHYVLELEKQIAQEKNKIIAGDRSEEETAAPTKIMTADVNAATTSSSSSEKKSSDDAQEVVNRTKHLQSHLFASLTLLSHFARARPEMLIQYIDTLVNYLTIAESSVTEFRVLNQIITMLEQIIPLMDVHSVTPKFIKDLDRSLNEIARDGGMLLIASSISCMSVLYEQFQSLLEQPSVCKPFLVYFKYLYTQKRAMEQHLQQQQNAVASTGGTATAMKPYQLSADKKPMLLRALYSIGLMCRHFDFDALLDDAQRKQFALVYGMHRNSNGVGNCAASTTTTTAGDCNSSDGMVPNAVFSLLYHFSKSADPDISQKALIALGQLSAGYTELLRRSDMREMYTTLLCTDKPYYLQLKVQTLKNIGCFLHATEQKALRRAEQSKRERDQRARQQREAEEEQLLAAAIEAQEDLLSASSGDVNVLAPSVALPSAVDDLKEMDQSSSGSIIPLYWTNILNCYLHNDELVRVNAAQVVRQTLEQGLVTPGTSVPTLIAMTTDPLFNIRTRADALIRDMNAKYKGMILSRSIPGARKAFQLQCKIRSDDSSCVIRGIRLGENPLNSSSSTTASPDNKNAFFTLPTGANDAQSLLANFYVTIRKNREERRNFLASLLKLFSDEHKEKVGRREWVFLADNLAHFPYTVLDEPLYVIYQANSIISVSGQSILSQFRQLLFPQTGTGELDEFSVDYIIGHLPSDRTPILELMQNSQACFLLLYLKLFLMRLYGLSKVDLYSPSEAKEVYEKPCNRRNIRCFAPDLAINEGAITPGTRQRLPVADEAMAERRRTAEHFHKFHEMLLQLDNQGDDEEEDGKHRIDEKS